MTAWLYRAIVQAILGTIHRVTGWCPLKAPTQRYFTDSPRKRLKQTVTGPNLFAELEAAML